MTTVQTQRVKIASPAKYAAIFVTCMMLASCSSSQNAFFTKRNALMSQGYKWQQLDSCRPAREDALSIPVIVPDGRKLVCFVLVPTQGGDAATATAMTPPIAPEPSLPATPAPATTLDTNSGTSGIVWNFSDF